MGPHMIKKENILELLQLLDYSRENDNLYYKQFNKQCKSLLSNVIDNNQQLLFIYYFIFLQSLYKLFLLIGCLQKII